MKTLRKTVLSLCLSLVLSGGYGWAMTPGSGVTGGNRDGNSHKAIEHSPATEAEMAALEAVSEEAAITDEVLLVEQPELNKKRKKQARKAKVPTQKEAESAESIKINLQEELMRVEEAQEASLQSVRGAAGQVLLLTNIVDRDDFPVSDSAMAMLLLLMMAVPPATVLASTRQVNSEFWFNVLLTSFFWFPGLVHAVVVQQRNS